VLDAVVDERATGDISPGVEIAIGAIISGLELLGRELGRPVDDMARVVAIPVVTGDAALGGE
jgi:hypothetical protein